MGNENQQNYPEGMVSYWKFDEGGGTVAGDSAGDNDGTIHGATWTTGQVEGALSFDGNDYVNLGHGKTLAIYPPLSIEAWIYPDEITGDFLVITKGDASFRYYKLQFIEGKLDFNVESAYGYARSPEALEPYHWYHVVGIHDGSISYLYINSKLVDSVNAPFTGPRSSNAPLIMGSELDKMDRPGLWYRGLIDEVAIYNRAITPDEIKQHYENGLKGLGYGPRAVIASVNIDPDTLNLKSRGVFTAYITPPEGYSVENIDAGTLGCSGASATKTSIEDGVLVAKFNKEDLDIVTGDAVELAVTGELTDGTQFEGSDTIRVTSKGKTTIMVKDALNPPYIANSARSSLEVHRAECIWVTKMLDLDKVPFETLEEAHKQGYDNCAYCIGDSKR